MLSFRGDRKSTMTTASVSFIMIRSKNFTSFTRTDNKRPRRPATSFTTGARYRVSEYTNMQVDSVTTSALPPSIHHHDLQPPTTGTKNNNKNSSTGCRLGVLAAGEVVMLCWGRPRLLLHSRTIRSQRICTFSTQVANLYRNLCSITINLSTTHVTHGLGIDWGTSQSISSNDSRCNCSWALAGLQVTFEHDQ